MKNDNWRERVASDPEVMHGEACIRGTRIPVSIIVASLLSEFPQLTREDVHAALHYAAEAAHITLVA